MPKQPVRTVRTVTPPDMQFLIERAKLQVQANRYGFLRRNSDNRLVQKIADR